MGRVWGDVLTGRTVMSRKLAEKRKLEEESVREGPPNHGSFGRSSVTDAPVGRCFSGTRDGPALGLWWGWGPGP